MAYLGGVLANGAQNDVTGIRVPAHKFRNVPVAQTQHVVQNEDLTVNAVPRSNSDDGD